MRCGAHVLAQSARDERHAAGARPRRDRLSGPEALTPSERRVARLAAEGKSNPEIAQELFLTRRTVETHLTHAYQKLGIGSREELTTALSADAR
jgi:DNA-binding CsgD family transcriptional regulator